MKTDQLDALLKRLPEIAKAVNEFDSAEIQREVFRRLMDAAGMPMERAAEQHSDTTANSPPKKRGKAAASTFSNSEKGNKSPRRDSEKYELIDIDFHPSKSKSLKEFYEEKSPKSDPEKYAVIMKYLEKILGLNNITRNHLYSAFKALSLKVPNVSKGLNNTRGRHGWVQFSGNGPISLTRIGENYVDHDLPKSGD
jgi:hypothetical protein